MNCKKRTTHIRIRMDDKEKIKKVAREMSVLEENDVKSPEVIRRMASIPNIREVLLEDAKMKRRFKNK